jgi:hypothetical protein
MKSKMIKLAENLGVKKTRVESAAKLNSRNIMRFHSLSVLTDLAVRNIGRDAVQNYYIAEAGIGYGETFSFLAVIASSLKVKLIGFDSFKGFPDPVSELDQRAWGDPTQAGQWNINDINSIKTKISATCDDQEYADKYVEFVSGFFEDSLKNFEPPKKFMFVHLDVDLHSSYKTCLPFFYDRLAAGGVMGFDEYNDPKWPGAKQAVDEFCEASNLNLEIEAVTGRAYLVK